MTVKETPEGIRVEGVEWLRLEPTLDSGQCFRFRKQEGGVWFGIAGQHPLTLREEPDGLLFENIGWEEFEGFWRDYFDLDRDYGAILEGFPRDDRLRECLEYAPGVRILRQDGFETLISFLFSQNNNVPRIKGIIERLCGCFGEPVGEGLYGFPGPERLAALGEGDLAPLRCGWRSAYVLDAARKVASGEVDLGVIAALPLDEARAALQTIRGVGPKVAECVLLYGLGRLEAFPLDVWMKRAMKQFFPGRTPESFGPYAGVAQQAVFHYCRRHAVQVRRCREEAPSAAGEVPGGRQQAG